MLDPISKVFLTVHKLLRAPAGAMAVAVFCGLLMAATAQDARAQAAAATAQPEKKPKDRAEYDLYNEVIKDGTSPAKQLQDLDSWTQKYPETDLKMTGRFSISRPTTAPTSRRKSWTRPRSCSPRIRGCVRDR